MSSFDRNTNEANPKKKLGSTHRNSQSNDWKTKIVFKSF